jgi:hypothetical protein
MKILVYGHKGWIGQQFINILEDKNIDYILGNSRVDNINDVLNELNTTKSCYFIYWKNTWYN